jgi:hypothetical protein
MSNARAIAAVTATLRSLLEKQVPIVDAGLNGLKVTNGPLDLARKNIDVAQINLFLYQTVVNAALSNQDLPLQTRPGETAPPPLALNLHFLLTAFGAGETDNDALSHRVLGGAMIVLHSHPLLGREEIKGALTDNDLHRQIERVRITPLPLGVEELSKLWTIFQTPYRLSAAYEATVVLIDSRRSSPAPLPVLKRGDSDRGPIATGQLAPLLSAIELPRGQPAVRLGEEVRLAGEHLGGGERAQIFNPNLDEGIGLAAAGLDDNGALKIPIPDPSATPGAISDLCPGFYTIAVQREVAAGVPPVSSNALSLGLAPTVTLTSVAKTQTTVGAVTSFTIQLTLECVPRIREGQRVRLIFGDQQVAPAPFANPPAPTAPTVLSFEIKNVAVPAAGQTDSYVVRLRVDGVDSIPAVLAGDPPLPAFDPAQIVTVP